MTFEDFKTNVQQWATERGIYEHSTAVAQALKAVSELGELCDAVVKGAVSYKRGDLGFEGGDAFGGDHVSVSCVADGGEASASPLLVRSEPA
jgi:hypothetical protein